MPSPFPGMDPYLENHRNWPDFHNNLAGEIQAWLNQRIQPKYYATFVTYITYDVIEIGASDRESAAPDVSVWRTTSRSPIGAAVAVIDPPPIQSVVKLEVPFRLANVEVRMTKSDQLITAIEILSPVNKRPGRDRDKYLRKRTELLRLDVHVLEIDLLRGGERSPLEVAPPPAPYYVTLAHGRRRPFVDLWPIQLDNRMPVVAVPLTAPDPDVLFDLGAIVQTVYERGAYGTRINYAEAVPAPALTSEQKAGVDQLLRRLQQ